MANCNNLFTDYNKVITPSAEEMSKMRVSREALEKKITEKIQEKLGMKVSYYTQGSSAKAMKTIIIKEDGTYDADRGVYLPEKPSVSATTVQGYVFDAVKDHTEDGAEHRKKCIRVFYRKAYNIDFPVYYEVSGGTYAYIAVKGDGWIKDDPAAMIEWFNKHRDENGQLIRMVKYLKAWASKCDGKMPSGIALSIWAAKNFTPEIDRDDKCLLSMVKAILNSFFWDVSCKSPVEPYDDVISKLSDEQKTNFKNKLKSLRDDAEKALAEPNQLKASKLWRKHLGDRFKLGVDDEIDNKLESLLASASTIMSGKARLGINGDINSHKGVPHQSHRNYGG